MRDFALEVFFSKWEFAARYNLAGSDGENMTLAELLALASPEDRAAYDGLSLGYTETFGAPALRAEIARTYDTVTPEHLLCFAGAEEGVYVAMQVLLRRRQLEIAMLKTAGYNLPRKVHVHGFLTVDGAKMSHGETMRFNHGDLAGLERKLQKLPEGTGTMVVPQGKDGQ